MAEISLGISILQGIIIFVLIILPLLILILLTGLELREPITKFYQLFLCIFFPLIVILIGVVVGVDNFGINVLDIPPMWYYVISVTWFGLGIIFYGAII